MVLSIIIILCLTMPDLSEGTMLTNLSICSRQKAVFRCTVDGGVITTWTGPALENCSAADGSITLRHSQFGNGISINKTCGTTGQVIGQAISAENGSFTSNLIIEDTQRIIGSQIICTNNVDYESNVILFQIISSEDIDVCGTSSSSRSPATTATITMKDIESITYSMFGGTTGEPEEKIMCTSGGDGKSDLNTSLFIGIGAGIVILLITVLSIIVIIALIRSKAKLQKELDTLTAGSTNVIRFYEEVNTHSSPSPTLINTQENSAYGVCI